MKKALFVVCPIVALFIVFSVSHFSFFEFLELKLLDVEMAARGGAKPEANIIVAAIDEKSLKEFGQWPWPRDKMAALVRNLNTAGAKVVAFDVVFAEEDRGGKDAAFADELKKFGGAILGHYFDNGAKVSNIPLLDEAATGASFNISPDRDGIVRRLSLKDSLAIATVAKFTGFTPLEKTDAAGNVTHVIVGNLAVPTDTLGRMMINYAGPPKIFPYVSVADIINGQAGQDAFKDAIVLVGTTAVGLSDVRPTPFSTAHPGIEIHASAISNILSGNFLTRSSQSDIISLAGLIAVGILSLLVLSRVAILPSVIFQIVVVFGTLAGGYAVFVNGVWIPVIYIVLEALALFIGIMLLRYFTEGREKRRIHEAFKYYLAPEVIENMLEGGSLPKLGGERREMTILFSDVRNFTTISEGLDPANLVSLMNEYFTQMTDIIMKEGGMVDKFIGDAVMAFFGAPAEDKKHAEKACRAALLMQEKVSEMAPLWAEKYKIGDFKTGVGINTGVAYVGNMGSKDRFNYTAIGDSVNVASRLEGLTKQYSAPVIVSGATRAGCGDGFKFRPLGQAQVKGKTLAIEIFELAKQKSI